MLVPFAGLAVMASPSRAHHSASAFDLSAPVVLEDAVVTEFLWINPHPLIKADYTDEQGNVQHWTMEMGSTVSAQLIGWTRTALRPGDVVTLYVWQAKTGAHVGRFNRVDFPTVRSCVIPSVAPTTEGDPTWVCASSLAGRLRSRPDVCQFVCAVIYTNYEPILQAN